MSKSQEINLVQKLQNTTVNKMQSGDNKSGLVVAAAAKNKILQKPILNPKGLQQQKAALSANRDTNSQDPDDDSRKKRCADRYDSSESSDSGVATLSCTDSSTTSSDTSDPGSPYSSTCDDTNNVNHNNNKMPPHQKSLSKVKTQSTLPVTTTAMLTPKTNAILQKQQNLPHEWPWNSRPPPPPKSVPAPAKTEMLQPPMLLPQQQLLLLQQQQINGNKLKRSTEVQTTITGNKRIKSTAPAAPVDKTPQIPTPKAPKPPLIMDETSSQKITGYFKSQKTNNSTLKKDIGNLVAKTSVAGQKLTGQNPLNNYYNLLMQQATKDSVSAKTVDVLNNELDIRTLTTAVTAPTLKKKTAKISPTVRKMAPTVNATTAAAFTSTPSVSITQIPKKPLVAIAPRLPELKPNGLAKPAQTINKYAPDMANLQKLALEQAKHGQPKVLLTAIRLPTQQSQQQKPQAIQQKISSPPALTLTTTSTNGGQNVTHTHTQAPPLFQIPVLPNLVQIPNLVAAANAAKNAAANLMVNNSMTAAAAKWNNQLFMHGAAFMKLQQFGQQQQQQQQNGSLDATQGLQNFVAKQVPFTTSSTVNGLDTQTFQLKTQNGYPISNTPPPLAPAHYTSSTPTTTQHHQMTPQVFMTSSGLLLNAALPTMLTQAQLANLQTTYQQQTANLPALHPIQPQSGQNTTATPTVLPSINTILHNNHQHHNQQLGGYYQNGGQLYQQTQQILTSPLITTSVTSKFTTQQQFTTTGNFVPISSGQLFITSSSVTPTFTGATTTVMANNNQPQMQQVQQLTQQSLVQPPPLQKVMPTSQRSPQVQSQTVPKVQQTLPPPPLSKPTISPTPVPITSAASPVFVEPAKPASVPAVEPVLSPPVAKPAVATPPVPITPPTNQLTITTKTVKSLTTVTHALIDLCSPTVPLLSPKERIAPCLASPKSLVLERIKSKKPPELFVDEFGFSSTTYVATNTIALPLPIALDIDFQTASLPESAKSPILSQPKTIRFPRNTGNAMRMGSKGSRRSDNMNNGVCGWNDCDDKFELNSQLMDHLQTRHINTQTGPYVCLWAACKVHSKESVSRSWLERHVLSCHGSEKLLHKCIVEGCSMRFGSKNTLEKHVNNHFTRNDGVKRSSDQFLPKVHRHKKEKRTRKGLQPWAARRFDYIDVKMMEGILFKLISAGAFATGPNGSIVFKGKPTAKRVNTDGDSEYLVQWQPANVLQDEWLTPTSLNAFGKLEKHIRMHELTPPERIALHEHFMQIGQTYLQKNHDETNAESNRHRKIVLDIIKNYPDNDSSMSSSPSCSLSSSNSSLSCVDSTPPSSAKRYRKTPKIVTPS